jgi:predicted transcriptional regulator
VKLRDEGLEELAARLEELTAALAAAQGQLGEAFEDIQDQAEDVAEELARDEPRKSRLTRLLKGIAEGARDVAGVVNAAHALADAVRGVL